MAQNDFQRYMMASGMGSMGAGLGSMFLGNDNPADGAMKYLNQIPGAISPYYDPYINAGKNALPMLQGQYSDLINNPGGKFNEMGNNFHQSPGFQFALQQALQGSNHAAAAGGMAGSPQHEQQNMELATNLGNQDYYHWMNGAMNMYGQGLQGMGGMANMGLSASNSLSDQIAQALAAKSQLQYAGTANQNQAKGAGMGDLVGGAATLAAFL